MGNYIFSTRTLLDLFNADAKDSHSRHDFGGDILPKLAGQAPMFAYNFETNRIPGDEHSAPYWRDVGTIDAYYEANMDLNHVKPELNLYNREWPVRSTSYPDPPAKFVFDEEGRRGEALDSIVSGGCILSGGMVRKSVLGRGEASTPEHRSKDASSWTTAISDATQSCGAPFWIRMFAFRPTRRSATILRPTVGGDGM